MGSSIVTTGGSRTPSTDVITAFGISAAAPTAAPTVPPTISPTGPATAPPVLAPFTAPVAVVDCANALPDASSDTAISGNISLFFITSSFMSKVHIQGAQPLAEGVVPREHGFNHGSA